MGAHQSLNLRLIWQVLTTRRKPYIVVVKLNVWLHPYFQADPICFKSEPLTGLDPDLGLIVSRLWVGLGHQMAQWPHMYNAGKIFFTIVFYGKKEKQLTKPFTFWKWKLIFFSMTMINFFFNAASEWEVFTCHFSKKERGNGQTNQPKANYGFSVWMRLFFQKR